MRGLSILLFRFSFHSFETALIPSACGEPGIVIAVNFVKILESRSLEGAAKCLEIPAPTMGRRLNGRVDEAGADVVKISGLEEVAPDDFLEVRDDEAEFAARLQDSIALPEEVVRFARLPVVEVVLEMLKEVSCVDLVGGIV